MDSLPQRLLIGFATLFLVTTTTATLLRCYVRIFMVKSFGADDALSVLSLALFIATAICVLVGIHYSHGWHMIEIPAANIPKAMMMWYLCEIFYTATTACLRLSIALFLCRLIVSKFHCIIIWTVMSVSTLYSFGYFFFLIFQCSPVNYFWTQFQGKPGKCVAPALVGDLTYVHGIFSIVADLTLAILPVFLVWNLQMNPRTKFTLAAILGLGAIGSCAVIVRFPYVVALEHHATDFLYYCTNVVLWTSIEPGLAITASSLATLRPLFQTFLSSSIVSGKNTSGHYKTSGNCMSLGKSKTGGSGGDRSHPTEGILELNDFGGKGFRSVVTTTITTAGSSKRPTHYRSASQEVLKQNVIYHDGSEVDLSRAPPSKHGEWPTRITKTVEVRTQSSFDRMSAFLP